MTPLAHRLAKELTLPAKRRDPYIATIPVAELLRDVHCFDLSPAMPLVALIAEKFRDAGLAAERSFLPAPRTWLEFTYDGGKESCDDGRNWTWSPPCKEGVLLEQQPDGNEARVTQVIQTRFSDDADLFELCAHRWTLPLLTALPQNQSRRQLRQAAAAEDRWLDPFEIYAALALINTPRLMGRRQIMPHRGLQRDLLRQSAPLGSFPLRAYTEILLSVKPTEVGRSGVKHEAHLTGRKCLHFCRAHLRIRNGRLEVVSSHWRGDPALGLKRSRYRIVPDAQARPGRLQVPLGDEG